MTDTIKLPEPDYRRPITYGMAHTIESIDYYTAETVRRLIAEAVAAEREACAVLCDKFRTNALLINSRSELYGAFADAGFELARAIRARNGSTT